MLLRSASTPILKSWIHHCKESSPEPEILSRIPKYRPISRTASSSSPLFSIASMSSPQEGSLKSMTRALSENDLRRLSVPAPPKKRPQMNGIALEEEEEEEETEALDRGLVWRSTGSNEECENDDGLAKVLVGGGVGGSGGKICGGGGGGGSDGGDDGSSGFWDPNRGNDSTDVYYQKMIEANPGNSLLLSNYARFLKEVRGDFGKAEQYLGRAILANPNDGSVLSMYADLIWVNHKDASRAENYFDQAVKVAPDDCYVLASYARFLWDAEEEEEEDGDGGDEMTKLPLPTLFHGAPTPPPPLAAAS